MTISRAHPAGISRGNGQVDIQEEMSRGRHLGEIFSRETLRGKCPAGRQSGENVQGETFKGEMSEGKCPAGRHPGEIGHWILKRHT